MHSCRTHLDSRVSAARERTPPLSGGAGAGAGTGAGAGSGSGAGRRSR